MVFTYNAICNILFYSAISECLIFENEMYNCRIIFWCKITSLFGMCLLQVRSINSEDGNLKSDFFTFWVSQMIIKSVSYKMKIEKMLREIFLSYDR